MASNSKSFRVLSKASERPHEEIKQATSAIRSLETKDGTCVATAILGWEDTMSTM